jgi:CRP/FNR family transcriptional regulator
MTKPTRDQLLAVLKTHSFFAGVDVSLLEPLLQTAVWREYDAGEVVVLEGQAQPGLYFLQYGWLKATKVSAAGREQVLRFLEPGETFNEVGVFTNQPNPATAIALEPAGVWLISQQAIRQLVRQYPEFAEHILGEMANRMLYLVSLVTDLSLRPIAGRLARLLLAEATDDVLHRPRWYTQAELAARLGTVPDVVQRALRQLENDGLIAVERQLIRILDRPALAELAE